MRFLRISVSEGEGCSDACVAKLVEENFEHERFVRKPLTDLGMNEHEQEEIKHSVCSSPSYSKPEAKVIITKGMPFLKECHGYTQVWPEEDHDHKEGSWFIGN